MSNILVFSDVHLGHHKTKTDYIISNLRTVIHYLIENEKIDLVCIAGDLIDRRLWSDDIVLSSIIGYIYELMTICKNNNVSLRVMKGTPSHDWDQLKLFNLVYEKLNEKFDFAYYDDVIIEYNERLKKTILYIPDEWGMTAEYTFNYVKKLMKDKNLSQIDLAFMHGMFDYQVASLPNMPFSKSVHKSSDYLSIIKYYIFIGHIHTFSTFERIIAEGSFDRLAHNEEEDKGCVLFHLDDDVSKCSYEFIVNKNAKIYKTIEVKQKDINKAISFIEKEIKKYPKDSYIRLLLNKDSPFISIYDKFVLNQLDYHFSKKILNNDKTKETMTKDFKKSDVTINEKNIHTILKNKLDNLSIDSNIKSYAIKIFEELKGEIND